jgi:hypothetical protein
MAITRSVRQDERGIFSADSRGPDASFFSKWKEIGSASRRSYCVAAADSRAHRRRLGLAHRDRLCCSVRGIENGNFFFKEFEIGFTILGHKHQRRMKSINPIIH